MLFYNMLFFKYIFYYKEQCYVNVCAKAIVATNYQLYLLSAVQYRIKIF